MLNMVLYRWHLQGFRNYNASKRFDWAFGDFGNYNLRRA